MENYLIGLAGLATAISASASENEATQAKEATPDQPNIVFILADDMGYGDLSCFGSRHVKTPNIDRLSETGTTFTQCYAGSGISSPSRCALMTGKNTGNTTIRDNMCPVGGIAGYKVSTKGDSTIVRRANLLPSDTTIADVVKKAGYRTCLVNKWHLDGYDPTASPNHRGFDEFYGWTISTVHSNAPYYYPYYRFHGDSLINIEANAHDRRVMHNTDLSTEDAIKFINRNKNNPFFLYLAYDAPHEPYIIEDTSWYDERDDWSMNTKRYAALITHMDAAIGRVIEELERLNLRENTLVIFASDNGAAIQAPLEQLNCNAGFKGRKGQLYEGGIRVPLIVNQPGKVPAKRLENIVYFPDMMPTFAAITRSSDALPKNINGMDISPLFFGKDINTDDRLLYWEFTGKQRAARRGDWKCVTVKRDMPLELYNLKVDPEESTNLAEKYPEIVEQFDKEMKLMHKPSPYWPLPGEEQSVIE